MLQTTEGELLRLLRERREQLRSEAARIDEERAYLQAEYTRREAQLRDRVERLEKELHFIDQMLELRDGATPERQPLAPRLKGRRIEDAVYSLLASERRGLHYKVILERLGTDGIPVSGRNPAATLVARLIRDGRFSRPKQRGVYALREWAPNARDVGSRAKRSRARRVA
jgi:hypothetical protein